MLRIVSIHPPLCRRGEREDLPTSAINPRFQSTPRFVGEGNALSVTMIKS